jgi:hypothetical protein
MVNSCTAQPHQPLGVSLESDAFEAAATVWAMVEVAESLPATPETRAQLKGARRALRRHLDVLGLDEELLAQRLRASVQPPEPPGARIGPAPPFP